MHRVAEDSTGVPPSPDERRRAPNSIADAPSHPVREPTAGAALERLRLVHRARRIERVLAVLHSRARARPSSDTTPVWLNESIADFSHELDQVRQRLGMTPEPLPALLLVKSDT